MLGYIYLAVESETGYIKIGRSRQPDARISRLGGQGSRTFTLAAVALVGDWLTAEATLRARVSMEGALVPPRAELFDIPLDEALRVFEAVARCYPAEGAVRDEPCEEGLAGKRGYAVVCRNPHLVALTKKTLLFCGKRILIQDLLASPLSTSSRGAKALEKVGLVSTGAWQGTRWFLFTPPRNLVGQYPELAPFLSRREELALHGVM